MKNFIFLFVVLFAGAANSTLIDFDSFPSASTGFDGGFTGGVEDGFTISVDQGSFLATSGDFLGAVSGINSLHHSADTQSGITITNGGLFEFVSLQSGGFFGGAEDLTITGYLSGAVVATDVFSPANELYTLFNATNLLNASIDTLYIDMGPAGPGPTHIDDIMLNAISVPEPLSIALFGFGLAVMRFSRKKQAV